MVNCCSSSADQPRLSRGLEIWGSTREYVSLLSRKIHVIPGTIFLASSMWILVQSRDLQKCNRHGRLPCTIGTFWPVMTEQAFTTQAWHVSPIIRHWGKVYTKQQALCLVYHEDTAVLQRPALPCPLPEDPKGSSPPHTPVPASVAHPTGPARSPQLYLPSAQVSSPHGSPSTKHEVSSAPGASRMAVMGCDFSLCVKPTPQLHDCMHREGPLPMARDRSLLMGESPLCPQNLSFPEPQSWQAVEGLFLP